MDHEKVGRFIEIRTIKMVINWSSSERRQKGDLDQGDRSRLQQDKAGWKFAEGFIK